MSYSCHHYLIPVCFQHLKKKHVCTIYQALAFPLRLAVGHHLFTSVSRDRPLLDILHTGNRVLCGLSDWLPSLSSNVSKGRAHCSMCQCFVSRLSNISLCGYFVRSKWAVTFDPFICWKIFGCFSFWTVMNNAALHFGVQVFMWHVFSSLEYVPCCGIAGP